MDSLALSPARSAALPGITWLIKSLEGGTSLSKSIKNSGVRFNHLLITLIQNGEVTGRLGEALSHAHLYLEKISRLVRKDGLVAITTGDIESVNARWRKEKWRLLHPPTHLYYFSKKSIDQLLKRYDLEVIYNKYCGFYRSIDNIAYNIFVLRNKKKFIYDCLKKSGLTQLCVYINLFDIFYIVARKK